jgi:hypothetical protein
VINKIKVLYCYKTIYKKIGAAGMSVLTVHKDDARKQRYI